MNQILLYPIVLPIVVGLVCLVLPRRARVLREVLMLLTAVAALGIALYIFVRPDLALAIPWLRLGLTMAIGLEFRATAFARLVLVAAALFALLIGLYSLRFMAGHPRHKEYCAYFLATLGMTSGAVLANNLIVLLFFWELHGFLLFLMAGLNGDEAIPPATKTLIIAGSGDLALLLGIILLWLTSGTLSISEIVAAPQALDGWLPITAFLLMMAGALTKAGAIPLHSWIPAIATTTPTPVMAYLPASLDKLLGIYLLARIALDLFVTSPAMGLILMTIGAITILGAVLMALIQHDYRKMLAFHAVSQVGYMVLGIGTGVPVGVIGGLFHMLNHAIYKCCLFLCGGSVQHQTGRTKFSELGGLVGAMPWTFVSCLAAALAISGVPPMNGFVSKWFIYQGILERGDMLFPLFLMIAMFGSALTLASFVKLLYSMFWGERAAGLEKVKEAPWTIFAPLLLLATICLAFGVFYRWPVEMLITPLLGERWTAVHIPGLWESGLAALLLILSLLAGFVIYLVGRPRGMQETEVFVGGEALDAEFYRVPGTHFYGPVKELGGLKRLYALAERGAFDIYTYGVRLFRWLGRAVYGYVEGTLGDLYQEVVPALLATVGQVLRLLNRRLILTYLLWVLYAAGIVGVFVLPGNAAVFAAVRIVACTGMLGWALLALVESDLKCLLILAATSQAGFVVLGLTLSPGTALVYLATAGVALVALALCLGAFARALETSALDRMQGLAARMPGWFTLFLLAAFWLAGLPPFGNFFAKYLLGVAAEGIGLPLSVVITGTAILTLGYLLRPVRYFSMASDLADAGHVAHSH